MKRKTYQTASGNICYWADYVTSEKPSLVFLPGLTADHRLFDKQIEYFAGKYNLLVWDAPGHADSWPFQLNFSLMDKATWLYGILEEEKLFRPVLIGQSMGSFVGQAFAQLYPDVPEGFVSINSAPLQRKYMNDRGLWLLKRMDTLYRIYPWKAMLKAASKGVSTTEYGQKLMHDMMLVYNDDPSRNARLAGHGFKMLADAIEADLPYVLKCPAMLICGEKDKIKSMIHVNRLWHEETGIPLHWVKNAGHNSNTDQPEIVNHLIETFVESLGKE